MMRSQGRPFESEHLDDHAYIRHLFSSLEADYEVDVAASSSSVSLIRTPLHHAAIAGDASECKRLLEMGASVDARDDKGLTPLGIAVSLGYLDVIEILIDAGADYNQVLVSMNEDEWDDDGDEVDDDDDDEDENASYF